MRKTKKTPRFDSVYEKNQKLIHVFIMYMRKTKDPFRFDSAHKKSKNYFTFR